MAFQLYEATLRRRGRNEERVTPFLLGVDLDDQREAALTDARLYRALSAAARRAGCSDLVRELDEYDLQLRERGGRDVKATFASHWRVS